MKTYRKPKAKIVNTKGHVILAGSFGEAHDRQGDSGSQQGGFSKSIFDYESE